MAIKPPTRQRSRSSLPRSSAQHKTEYIYHWNRILGALATLMLVVGLIAFGLYAWLLAPSQPGMVMANGELSESLNAAVVRVEPVPEFDRVPSSLQELDSDPVTSPAEAALPGDSTPPEDFGVEDAFDLAQLEAIEALLDPVPEDVAEPMPPDADAPLPQAWPSDASSEEAAQDFEEGMIGATRASIVSGAVRRFSLAPSVVDNEPRGRLEEIRPDAGGIARVTAFSEVHGLGGETLHYVWFHQGREVARVRVPVRAGRWRSHSSKRVGTDEPGEWRVELQDSGGAVLARIDFLI